MKEPDYVHGYLPREEHRLGDQAQTLAEPLRHDTQYEPGSRVLEAGCGMLNAGMSGHGMVVFDMRNRTPAGVHHGFLTPFAIIDA